MAYWDSKVFINVGDAFGHPRRIAFGVVTVETRTSLGLQLDQNNPRDQPDYTFDRKAVRDLFDTLEDQRAALGRALGGW